jgi:transposase
MAAATDKGVHRMPVRLAQLGVRLARLRRVPVGGLGDDVNLAAEGSSSRFAVILELIVTLGVREDYPQKKQRQYRVTRFLLFFRKAAGETCGHRGRVGRFARDAIVARHRSAEVAQAVLGTRDGLIAVTDRLSAYDWIAGPSRQICWSHLRRYFQAMIDRGGAAEAIGRRLLRLSNRLFRWWHRPEQEEVDRPAFRAAMVQLRCEFKVVLEEGTRCACKTTGGGCAEILPVEESLWTFARVAGVPPTKNAAERAGRHAVIWRRISGGTDSARRSRFVERMLTVVTTCRQQGRSVLEYLSSCFQAARSKQAIPSLLPAQKATIKVA